jgi:tetratricopeptide (TPR) repeat protein
VIQVGEYSELFPKFYVNSRGFEQASELVGEHRLGDSLRVPLPFNETTLQDVENPALSARIKALSLLVIGLAYSSTDQLDKAVQYYQAAEQVEGWLKTSGKDVLYLLEGNAYLRWASIDKDTTYLPLAENAYRTALEINPGYPRALMGQGGVLYLRALGDPFDNSPSSIDLALLREAEDDFRAALTAGASPTDNANLGIKAHFNLGQCYLARSQVEGNSLLPEAVAEFQIVTQTFETGNLQVQEMASQSYARLALINKLVGNLESAIDLYQKAIAVSSPKYQAYYNAKLAEVLASMGRTDDAIAALEEAIKISESYVDSDAVESYTQQLIELKNKKP